MRTETVEVFQYGELSDKAKEKAREWYRSGDVFHWGDDYVSSLQKFAEWFNLKIKNYSLGGSDNRNQHVDYELNVPNCLCDSLDDILKGVRLWKYMSNQMMLPDLTGNCPFTGMCADETLLDPVREFMKRPDMGMTYAELMRNCIDAFCKAYRDEVDYAYSDEAVAETIEANEYEFTADGERWA